MDPSLQTVEQALRVGLQLLAYTLQPAAQAEVAERSQDIFHHELVAI
ncbi:hypothetical protein ACVDG5_027325 [Mesorhizobium sp. ORM6]